MRKDSTDPVVEHKGFARREGSFLLWIALISGTCDARQNRVPARQLPGTS
jgi:hypothetical protein